MREDRDLDAEDRRGDGGAEDALGLVGAQGVVGRKAGEALYRVGDEPGGLYGVAEGLVEVLGDEVGRPPAVALAGSGAAGTATGAGVAARGGGVCWTETGAGALVECP